MDRLATGQRVIFVIALGLALGVLGEFLNGLGSGMPVGWYAYSPLEQGGFSPFRPGLAPWLRLLIWLVLIAVWALASIRAFRRSAPTSRQEPV